MKFLLSLNIIVTLVALLSPTHAIAVVSEVDINNAVVSNWFTANLKQMPSGTTHYAFRSPSNDADVGYTVYLPPDYATTTKKYPVMYWLHGSGGNELRALWLSTIVDNAIKAKQIRPMIVVFPNAGGKTDWSDTFDGSILTETMVINELVPLIDSKFRTIKNRSVRFLEGFSMGGFGAGKYLFKYPELFSSAVTYGGGYNTVESIVSKPEFEIAFGGNLDLFLENSPSTIAQEYAASTDKELFPVSIRIVIGSEDIALESNRSFRDVLIPLDIPLDYLEVDGLTHHSPQLYYDSAGIEGFNFHF